MQLKVFPYVLFLLLTNAAIRNNMLLFFIDNRTAACARPLFRNKPTNCGTKGQLNYGAQGTRLSATARGRPANTSRASFTSVCERRRNALSWTREEPSQQPSCRVTDSTGVLDESKKRLLGRGPKFALATAVNARTEEACRDSFFRFVYQYQYSVAQRQEDPSERPDLLKYLRISAVHLPPTEADTESKLRRL